MVYCRPGVLGQEYPHKSLEDTLNTVTVTTAAAKTYTVEDLLAAGLEAYRNDTSSSELSDAAWLMSVAIEMTGPDENDEDEEVVDEYTRPLYTIWEAVTRVMYKQAGALTARNEGQTCCEVSQRLRPLR